MKKYFYLLIGLFFLGLSNCWATRIENPYINPTIVSTGTAGSFVNKSGDTMTGGLIGTTINMTTGTFNQIYVSTISPMSPLTINNGSNNVVVIGTGSFAIGTSSPSGIFDIAVPTTSGRSQLAKFGDYTPITIGLDQYYGSYLGFNIDGIDGSANMYYAKGADSQYATTFSFFPSVGAYWWAISEDTGTYGSITGNITDAMYLDKTGKLSTNNGYYTNNGKIAIGTSVTTEKLEVTNGNIKTNYGLIANTATITTTLTVSSITAPSGSLRFIPPSSPTLGLTMNNVGYVGIHNMNPQQELDITGQIINNGLEREGFKDTLPNGNERGLGIASGTGWGELHFGNNEGYAYFNWDTTGNVTLLMSSANVANSDTAGKMCIFSSGGTASVKNNLGTDKIIRYEIKYSLNS